MRLSDCFCLKLNFIFIWVYCDYLSNVFNTFQVTLLRKQAMTSSPSESLTITLCNTVERCFELVYMTTPGARNERSSFVKRNLSIWLVVMGNNCCSFKAGPHLSVHFLPQFAMVGLLVHADDGSPIPQLKPFTSLKCKNHKYI